MKFNYLNDLNRLRTAPCLNKTESLMMRNQIDKKILNSDWITIGIMANRLTNQIVVYSKILFKLHRATGDLCAKRSA